MDNAKVDNYLARLYLDFDVSLIQKANVSDAYGEVLIPSISDILSKISLAESDTVYDLGSGLGKVVLQIALQTNVKKVVGIEYNAYLHQCAQRACFAEEQKTQNIELIHGDFLEIPFDDANCILIFSPCFTLSMFENLARKINQLHFIHTVVSLRPLPNLSLKFIKSFKVQGTWDAAICYLYSNRKT